MMGDMSQFRVFALARQLANRAHEVHIAVPRGSHRPSCPHSTGTPATFADLVSTVTAFADPLATGAARGRAWDPATRTWQAT